MEGFSLSDWNQLICSLVNLIMNREVVHERIQENMTPDILEQDLKSILNGPVANKMKADYLELRAKMGAPGAADRAASEIMTLLRG